MLISLVSTRSQAALDTAFAVQASATVQSSPAQITLSWTPGPATANGYVLSRKETGAGAWTPLANLVGSATGYVDSNVVTGRLYEYQIARQSPGITGYGYLASGIDVPMTEFRGRIILVVDNSIAAALAGEIDQLARDLVGDGWTVTRREVGRGDTPGAVRDVIRAAYNEDRTNTRAALLLGHVPVARSGNLNIDGHAARPLPTDAFYADMDGNWTDTNGDGVFEQNQIPSDLELMVGRIDFSDMPGEQAAAPIPGETDLLRRYLKKDHEFRQGIRRVPRRALIGDRTGDAEGQAFGAVGFRTFAALFGPNNVTAANVEDLAPPGERWISRLTAQDWLWVYGSGGGSNTSMSGLGLHGQYHDVWSVDFVDLRARGMFYLMLGSWLVDWNQRDNIMRAALAAPDYGLAAAWSGRPHLFFQHMAMGETLGYGIRLSQNNTSLYTNQVNEETRGIHVALLGDPTLRLHVVAPATGLSAAGGGGVPVLTWTASPDADAGYHVYRAASADGPFMRVTNLPITATTFTDSSAPVGDYTYMVRAVRHELSGSGSYFNPSQGIFIQAAVTMPPANPAPPPTPIAPAPAAPAPAPAPPSGTAAGGGANSPWLIAWLLLLVFLRIRRGK
jgi:hypothetical protein